MTEKNDIEQLLKHARLLRREGRIEGAIKLLREAVKAAPDDARPHLLLGKSQWEKGKLRAAERLLKKAVRLAPGNDATHRELGEFLLEQRRYAEAELCMRRRLELRPDSANALYRLGTLLLQSGRQDEARQFFLRATGLGPDAAHPHYQLGLIHHERGELEEAAARFARAAELIPNDIGFRSAAASLLAELAAGREGRPGGKRVVLHLNRPLHYSILQPVFEALKPAHHVRMTESAATIAPFRPDVVVVADGQGGNLRKFAPGAKFVYVRHGLISKSHAFPAASLCDYLAGVSSPAIKDQAVRYGFAPDRVWVTGYVQMDPLFRGQRLPLPVRLPPGRTVLFAPTYNRKLSAATMLGPRVVELLRGTDADINVVIKPHPYSKSVAPEWIRMWREIALKHERVFLVDDVYADAMALLQAADVLVSDACSMAFAYLALDRPVILMTHPERTADRNYDPDGIEWQWRDFGEELFEAEELPGAVERALHDPARHAERRAHYRREVFGEFTDGRAAERIAEHIARLPA